LHEGVGGLRRPVAELLCDFHHTTLSTLYLNAINLKQT
jgi:hypothetical protein